MPASFRTSTSPRPPGLAENPERPCIRDPWRDAPSSADTVPAPIPVWSSNIINSTIRSGGG